MAAINISETAPYHPSDTLHFTGDSSQPDESLSIILTNDDLFYGVLLTTVTADGSGGFSGSATIPSDVVPAGSYYLRAFGDSSDLTSATFTIAAAAGGGGAPRGRIGLSGLSLGL